MCTSPEIYTAQYPVNRWIVEGEPVVSEDNLAFRIQQGQIEVHGGNVTGREHDGEIYCLSYYKIRGTVKESECNGINGMYRKGMLSSEL